MLLLQIAKCTLISSVVFGNRSERNAQKNEQSTVGFTFTTMLHHTGRFWSRISQQRAMWPRVSPILSKPDSIWFLTYSLDWNEYWRDGDFVRLLKSTRMRRKSWKVFDRMASRKVSNTFTTVDRSVLLHNGTLLKETWPKLLNGFVFLRNKAILWSAWHYHVQNDPKKWGIYFTRKSL